MVGVSLDKAVEEELLTILIFAVHCEVNYFEVNSVDVYKETACY